MLTSMVDYVKEYSWLTDYGWIHTPDAACNINDHFMLSPGRPLYLEPYPRFVPRTSPDRVPVKSLPERIACNAPSLGYIGFACGESLFKSTILT